MILEQRLQNFFKKFQITPDLKLDQNFLIDEETIQKLMDYGKITQNDRVLEIGAGCGFVTEKLVTKAKEVIAIEVDTRFKKILEEITGPVKLIFEDAYKFLDQKGKNKIGVVQKVISNMPFSFIQPILHRFTDWGPDKMIWITPTSFVKKVNEDHILGAYFKSEIIEKISADSFFPKPKTALAIIQLTRIPSPIESKNTGIFVRRALYKQEDKKLKNALRELIINLNWSLFNEKKTKNQTRDIIARLDIEVSELEQLVAHIKPTTYFDIAKKVGKALSLSS